MLTQQGVMELVSKDAGGLLPGSGWEQRKQVYCDMLEGYKSPTGSSVKVAIDVAALIIISACLKAQAGKKTQKYERDLKEIREKHEEELQDKEDLCKKYKRDLERERNKNKALEREMKDFEDRLMVGDIPKVNASTVGRDSVDSSPETRSFKRP